MAKDLITVAMKRKFLRYAKYNTPYDTGNLRHNAVRGRKWTFKNEFDIWYDIEDAIYLEAQEYGWTDKRTGKFHKGTHFILKTYLELAKQIEDYFLSNKVNRLPRLKRNFSQEEIDGDVRRMLRHQKSISAFKAYREVNR